MRGTATDHRAQGDDGIEAPGLGKLARGERQLEGAGHAEGLDILFRHSLAFEGALCAPQQALGNLPVPACHHDGEAGAGRFEIALDGPEFTHG